LSDDGGVTEVPETHYAKSGDVHIAYHVVGDGPIDLVVFGTLVSHVELGWESPSIARFLRGMASFSRLIVFDKRGVGMSDPVAGDAFPTLEQRMEDVRAVMDAAGSERAALFGTSEGGQLAVLFAATYPERALGLVLFNTAARIRRADDYRPGVPARLEEAALALFESDWGGDMLLDLVVPSLGADQRAREWWGRYFRRATSPGAAVAQLRMNFGMDVRHVLGAVQTPTLVLHTGGNAFLPADHGRYLAEHIPDASYVELVGSDDLPYLDAADGIVAETREFLTGVREPAEPDRVLTTVLFSDIVGSTEQATALGDRGWRDVLDAHDTAVRRQLERFRGARSRPPAMASSPPSTARRAPSAAGRRSAKRPAAPASTSGWGSTPARSSYGARTSAASPCTSPSGCARWRAPATCSSRGRCRCWLPAPASSSANGGRTSSRASPARGRCSPPRADPFFVCARTGRRARTTAQTISGAAAAP
jgi:pimeloyl-ACP methyl ester carboxylesterase